MFLDEIGDLPSAIQAKLLRVLEAREVIPVGSVQPIALDVRFIAATHRSLREEIARGTFREDLYYRLNGVTLLVPPLRERRGAILGLARQLLELSQAIEARGSARGRTRAHAHQRLDERSVVARAGGIVAQRLASGVACGIGHHREQPGLQRLGVRLETVEAVLGHVSGSRAGVVGLYQRHRFIDEAREALALWGDHVHRLLHPASAKVAPMRRKGR